LRLGSRKATWQSGLLSRKVIFTSKLDIAAMVDCMIEYFKQEASAALLLRVATVGRFAPVLPPASIGNADFPPAVSRPLLDRRKIWFR
jgi:hypothetical protein